MRIQISTTVSQKTRNQVNELIERHGYSLRDVITIAVDRMYKQEITMPQTNVRHIEIEYSDASMFGSESSDEYNVRASFDEFEHMLEIRLRQEYPNARISIHNTINDFIRIDGEDEGNHREGPWIGEIVHDVWESWDWLIAE